MHTELCEQKLALSNFIIICRIGRGSTSHVFKVQSIKTKKKYAMKVIQKLDITHDRTALEMQIEIHRTLHHANICDFVAHVEDQENHYIITEFCESGQITKLLLDHQNEGKGGSISFDNHYVLQIANEVAQALSYMHSEKVNIAHGDIKLSNILINQSHIKLCDFGYSRKMDGKSMKGVCGTLMFLAPEILTQKKIVDGKAADVWALGICLLALLNQGAPYKYSTPQELKQQIISGKWLKPNPTELLKLQVSQGMMDLIEQMLRTDIDQRITADQILSHPVFQGFRSSNHSPSAKSDLNSQPIPEYNCLNGSLFDSTADTLDHFESDSCSENQTVNCNKILQSQTSQHSMPCQFNLTDKICSISLHPQVHCIKKNRIEIQEDHTIRISIDNRLIYYIQPQGNYLYLQRSSHNDKKYKKFSYNILADHPSIHNMYRYAFEMVKILKSKQKILHEIWYNHTYFYTQSINKVTHVCHRVNADILLYKELSIKKTASVHLSESGDPKYEFIIRNKQIIAVKQWQQILNNATAELLASKYSKHIHKFLQGYHTIRQNHGLS